MTAPSDSDRLRDFTRKRLPIGLAGALGIALVLFTLWVFATQKQPGDTDERPKHRRAQHRH